MALSAFPERKRQTCLSRQLELAQQRTAKYGAESPGIKFFPDHCIRSGKIPGAEEIKHLRGLDGTISRAHGGPRIVVFPHELEGKPYLSRVLR